MMEKVAMPKHFLQRVVGFIKASELAVQEASSHTSEQAPPTEELRKKAEKAVSLLAKRGHIEPHLAQHAAEGLAANPASALDLVTKLAAATPTKAELDKVGSADTSETKTKQTKKESDVIWESHFRV